MIRMVTDTSELFFEVIMRQLLLLSFALLPVAAHAQTKVVSSVAPAPTMTASVHSPRAAVVVPASLPVVADKPAADVSTHLISTKQTIRATVSQDFAYPQDGSEGAVFGSPNFVELPKLEKYSSVSIAQADLAKAPSQTVVTVRMGVDPMGIPQDLSIVRSAGDAVDADTLAAVRQFRFKPASVEHVPAYSTVTLDVTIDKK